MRKFVLITLLALSLVIIEGQAKMSIYPPENEGDSQTIASGDTPKEPYFAPQA